MKEYGITKRLSLIIAWFDIWIGAYYDREKKRLYLMIPFIGLVIKLKETP